jgi:hypothetical protein
MILNYRFPLNIKRKLFLISSDSNDKVIFQFNGNLKLIYLIKKTKKNLNFLISQKFSS